MDVNVVVPSAESAPAATTRDDLAQTFAAELAAESGPSRERAPAAEEETEIAETEDAPEAAAPVEAEESDAVEADDTAPDEADDAAETPSAEEPIIAPSGMTDADKQAYAKLPTELKAWVAKQESARTADYTRKSQEVAERRKQFETAVTGVSTRLQALDQQLSQFTDNAIAPPDPALRNTDPMAYDDQLAAYMQAQHVKEIAVKEREKIQKEQASIASAMDHQYQLEKEQQLREVAPELFGPNGNKIGQEIQVYAKKLGYKPEQLRAASANDIMTLWKAQRFDAIEAAKKNVKTVPPQPMKVSKPGPAKAVGRPSEVSAALKNLEARPSRDNLAAAYLAEMRSERR